MLHLLLSLLIVCLTYLGKIVTKMHLSHSTIRLTPRSNVVSKIFASFQWGHIVQETRHYQQGPSLLGCLSIRHWGIWGDRVYAAPTPVVPDFDLKSVHLEIMNLVVAFRLWEKFWRHCCIHIYCDNEAVVQVVASHKTRDLFLFACIRNIWLLRAVFDVDLHIFHIRGFHNNKSDLLSRLHSNKMVDQDLLHQLRTSCIWDKVTHYHTDLDLHI